MTDSRIFQKQISISSDHRSLAGHFPGNPVVPGVVLIDRVRRCIADWKRYPVRGSNLKSVKFLSPVQMNAVSSVSLDLLLEEKNTADDDKDASQTKIEFRCLQGDDLVMQGIWLLQADGSV